MSVPEKTSGIYIHVPFCLHKCRYCDFYSITRLERMADYTAAILQEMDIPGPDFPPADTLYFGGGTPSMLPADQLSRIIERAAQRFGLASDSEITLEINPATLAAADLKALRVMGVNRLNIGIQSFQDDHLLFLGRLHSAQQAVACFTAARRAGFENVGIDLIYGLPDQSPARWRRDLLEGLALNPEHLSCYILSYEPGTPLFQEEQSGAIQRLAENRIVDLFHQTHEVLSRAGYEHYEISNFARSGHRSRHNRKYWNFNPYLGLGPSAHSYLHPVRWWNHRELETYLESVQMHRRPLAGRETLTAGQHLMEEVYLGLRQSVGLDLDRLGRILERAAGGRLRSLLARQQQQGLVILDPPRARLTPAGMLVLDQLAAEWTSLME